MLAINLKCVFSASLVRITYMYQYTIQYSLVEYNSRSKPNTRKREAIQYVCSSIHTRMYLNIFMQIFCRRPKKQWCTSNLSEVHIYGCFLDTYVGYKKNVGNITIMGGIKTPLYIPFMLGSITIMGHIKTQLCPHFCLGNITKLGNIIKCILSTQLYTLP